MERPLFHFSVPNGWMNDPNGTVYFDGEYHLFYQHHPDSLQWGPMHWGHAVSADLLHWQNLPIALAPDELGMIFSGSCVMDERNMSGFGSGSQPPMVAAYTSHRDDGERQSLAWSADRGRTWQKYEGNPIISEPALRDFRDPRLLYYKPGKHWVMVVAAGDRARLYGSADLKTWSFLSEIGPLDDLDGFIWECPDLFELPCGPDTKWVFTASMTGGRGVIYLVGSFDGKRFVPEQAPMTADYGPDFYAPITFSGAPGRTVWIGWMNNWAYAGHTPADGWRGMMTMPRELSLVRYGSQYMMCQRAASQLDSIPVRSILPAGIRLVRGEPFRLNPGCRCYRIAGLVRPGAAVQIGLDGAILFRLDGAAGLVSMIRPEQGNLPVHQQYHEPVRAEVAGEDGISFDLIVDYQCAELFIHGGTAVMTAQFFPHEGADGILITSLFGDNPLVSLAIDKMVTAGGA